MNVTFLFWVSLSIFLFYRIFSCYLVFLYSRGDYKLLFLQFFDLSFVVTLNINYKFQNIVPCSPQRYLTNLEAMFESYPQFLIQTYFLITLYITDDNIKNNNLLFSNWIVSLSIFISLISIVSKKWTQDKDLVNPKWQNLDFNSKLLKHCVIGMCDNEARQV